MENIDEKIKDVYSTYKGSLKTYSYSKNLGISKNYFNNRIDIIFPKEYVETPNDVGNLLNKYDRNILLFERVLRLGKGYTKHIFSVLVPEIKSMYVEKGLSYKEISELSGFPEIITVSKVRGFITRNNWKHTSTDKENNRIKGLRQYFKNGDVSSRTKKYRETSLSKYGVSNPRRLETTKKKAIKTNLSKYGYSSYSKTEEYKERVNNTRLKKYGYKSLGENPEFKLKRVNTWIKNYGEDNPMKSKKMSDKVKGLAYTKEGSIDFKPTKYVTDFNKCKDITSSYQSLAHFLKSTFPDKKSYTLLEISDIVGRPYNTIKRLFRVDGKLIINSNEGILVKKIHNFINSMGYEEGKDYFLNDRKAIKPLEIDFYFPKEMVGIEVNDFVTHNSTINRLGGKPKPKNYHLNKSMLCKDKGIRLIHAWEHYFNNPVQYDILKNAIKHALGRSENKVYARNTYVKEVTNISLKEFFGKNNIQGFRGANRAYALLDKKTDEILMAYSVGSSHFSHNKYDLEIIRGASKLDTTIVGGASKLWKYIIDNNPEVNSIVYYIDRNIYSGNSIGKLEGHIKLVSTQVGFWNYFPNTGEIKNRMPSKHHEIKKLVSQGKVWEIYNAGTETYVWKR